MDTSPDHRTPYKCMTAIPIYREVNQSSEYKHAHYVGIAVIYLSVSDSTVTNPHAHAQAGGYVVGAGVHIYVGR